MSRNFGFGLAFAAVTALCCVAVGVGGPARVVMPAALAAIVGARACGTCFVRWSEERERRTNY